ncbi:Two-component sensor histidine kinase, contains HisKA and HATPase domains [Aquamicrobium aerolatum DSM 21857]|uniref:histidine kinase n=2 Tax=Aerobium TaxID=3143707 RepID=A0A1I3Q7F2_9HYPH|nr:Two-component sensor histidine kinase, contains HisKA and HATPase domains [Aquamicrobium aerolatum DSM 21857]
MPSKSGVRSSLNSWLRRAPGNASKMALPGVVVLEPFHTSRILCFIVPVTKGTGGKLKPMGVGIIDSTRPGDARSPHADIAQGRGLLRALRNTGITVFYQTPDLKVVWGQNIPENWLDGRIEGKVDRDFLPASVASWISDRKRAVLETGISDSVEFRDGEDQSRWYDMWIDADFSDEGVLQGVITTVVEITERKHREQTLRTLLREVSHRSKNLLAIIQSIATQTGRYSTTIEGFLDRFRGRLHSLSFSQDLVTSSDWRGATLSELVGTQVMRFRGDEDHSVRFEGADVYLNPNAALHIGLALHELVVNSMSHGALARHDGRVHLHSELAKDGDVLILLWSERTVGLLSPIKRFGSVALERVVPLSLDGTATVEYVDGQLDYRLEIPSANFEIEQLSHG